MFRMMEQQPVRRRRRRRRSAKARNEFIAWLTYFGGLLNRAYHWALLLFVISVILILGLGAPFMPVEKMVGVWGHW